MFLKFVLLVITLKVFTNSFQTHHKHVPISQIPLSELKISYTNGYCTEHVEDETPEQVWAQLAQQSLIERLLDFEHMDIAKNIIILNVNGVKLRDVYALRKKMTNGIPSQDKMRKFSFCSNLKNIAFLKSECFDEFTPDVACETSALLTGVKSNRGTIAVTSEIGRGENDARLIQKHKVPSIAYWARAANKSIGLVTTSSVISPAVAPIYGHASTTSNTSPPNDLASQLIHGETGRQMRVVIGGGLENFLPVKKHGVRVNNENLIAEWYKMKRHKGESIYLTHVEKILSICKDTDYLLALFDEQSLKTRDDPILPILTGVGLAILSRDTDNGYMLYIQVGDGDTCKDAEITDEERRIRTMEEMFYTIQLIMDNTSELDTLVVVTTSGASEDDAEDVEDDPFSLSSDDELYSFSSFYDHEYDDCDDDVSVASLDDDCDISENGEDNILYARGPGAHLFRGFMDQFTVAHFIKYIACIDEDPEMCIRTC